MAHGVGIQHMDICKASNARGFGLVQQVQVSPIINVAIRQPVRLPGDPEGGDDEIDTVHDTGEGLGPRGLGLDQGIGGQIGRALPVADQCGHIPAASAVFGAEMAPKIAGGPGDEDGLHGNRPFKASRGRTRRRSWQA